jgi:toxin-antitoxin system PIN domain toxin
VLVYASREDAPEHPQYREWLATAAASEEAFGISELVLSAVVRIVTNPRILAEPAPLGRAFEFTASLREQPNALIVSPGPRHWDIFARLCQESGARGNLVTDAYLAALAIESGSEWITTDRDFARFPGLRWRHPLRT